MAISRVWELLSAFDKAIIIVPDNLSLENEGSAIFLQSVYVADESIDRLFDLVAHHIVPDLSISDLNSHGWHTVKNLGDDCISWRITAEPW